MPTVKDIIAGGAGALDEALFGIPEWLLKKVNREGVEKYIKENEPAYRTGEAIGTIGSMFVPIPGLGLAGAAGKAAKAVKGADTALDLAKGAQTALDVAKGIDTVADVGKATAKGIDWTKLGKYAKTGAASGALEGGVRGVTSEKKPEDILKDIQSGALFGAGGGVVGGAIADNLPRLLGEATESAEKMFLGATDLKGRQALQFLNDFAGPGAKGIGKLKKADSGRKELVRVGKEIGANIAGKSDKPILNYGKLWSALGDIAEEALPGVDGSRLFSEGAKRGLNIPELYDAFGRKNVDAILNKIIFEEGSQITGLPNLRAYLRDIVKQSFKETTSSNLADAGIQRLQRTVANGLLAGVDETILDIAKSKGIDLDFDKLKRDYLPMRAFAEASARDAITPTKVNLGSPTAEKLGAQAILGQLSGSGALGALGAAGGATQGEDWQEKAKNAALGALIGSVGSKAIGGISTRALGAAAPGVAKIEDIVSKIAPETLSRAGAQAGGEAASIATKDRAIQAAAPTNPQEIEAAKAGADAAEGKTPAYLGRILERMQSFAVRNGIAPDSPEFQRFANSVYLKTNGFSPEGIAPILYQDEGERAAYLKALEVSKRLGSSLGVATSKAPGGVFGIGASPEQSIEYSAALDQLLSTVGDVAKSRGSEKAAKAALNRILSGGESPERKTELVKMLLQQYGVDLDELASLGVA